MIMILQQSPAVVQNPQPRATGSSSPKPASAAPVQGGAPGRPAGVPEKPAVAEQPIIDRLIPAWQPARGVSQAAITLAAVLVLMLLVAGITSLLRRGVFFLKQREWKQPPPRIRAWKLGPEGMSYEMAQGAQFEDERIRMLKERVDSVVSNVHIINTRLPQLSLHAAEGGHELHPSNDGSGDRDA